MKEEYNHIEFEKLPDYRLAIIIHRHGPKEGMAGPLSAEGEQQTEEYFREAYEGFDLDTGEVEGIDIEHSPMVRAKKTSQIYSEVIGKYNNAKIKSTREDERLSEGTVAEHLDLIEAYGGKGGKWIKGWLMADRRLREDVKTGREAVQGLASWLLEKITKRKQEGGTQEIDAFSHGPLMLGFLLKLEEKLGYKILPDNWEDKKVFENILYSLSYMNFYTESTRPEVVTLYFKGHSFEVPLTIIQELAAGN